MLVPQEKSDQSLFLNQYGYTQQNWQQLDRMASSVSRENIEAIALFKQCQSIPQMK
ncbi:MAG: hypothetical protein HC799_13555 [Limnothrix sp. RL_2_0]|nr:hypothetical protein [Limnothrix sp. RL_2_0]